MPPRRTTPKGYEHARALRHVLTPAEQKFWAYLRGDKLSGVNFRRQHAIGSYIGIQKTFLPSPLPPFPLGRGKPRPLRGGVIGEPSCQPRSWKRLFWTAISLISAATGTSTCDKKSPRSIIGTKAWFECWGLFP